MCFPFLQRRVFQFQSTGIQETGRVKGSDRKKREYRFSYLIIVALCLGIGAYLRSHTAGSSLELGRRRRCGRWYGMLPLDVSTLGSASAWGAVTCGVSRLLPVRVVTKSMAI
jgi:hypothetical protein